MALLQHYMFCIYFLFCFDEIEHQVTHQLQNVNAFFQVGSNQVSFLNIHLGKWILFLMVDFSVKSAILLIPIK